MRLEYRAEVGPVEVSGRGIPFSPRTMWGIVMYRRVDDGEWDRIGTTTEAYWSRSVALRIAALRPKMYTEYVRAFFKEQVPNG